MRLRDPYLAPVAVLILAAGAGFFLAARENSVHEVRPAPFVVVDERGTASLLNGGPGIVAVTSMATIRVTAPFRVLRVTPLRSDPDVELLAVRAFFWGQDGSHTASGYRRLNFNPANDCGNQPITGHGATYPVENLWLRPGDNTLKLVYYTTSRTSGRRAVFGHRIAYETPDGRKGEVSGEGVASLLNVSVPGAPRPAGRYLPKCDDNFWTTPFRDYPA